jgi:hypothetical protein
MRCINFISQLYYFSRKRYIPRDIWRKGEARYAEILKSPLFLHVWKKIAPTYVTDGAFCRYVEKTQQLGEGKPNPARTPLDKSLAAER